MTTRGAKTPGQRTVRRTYTLGRSEELGRDQVALGLVVVLTPAAFIGCAVLAGAGISAWLLVLVPSAVLLVREADAVWPLVAWTGLGVLWVVQVPGVFSWWAVPAAVCVLLSHVATGLLAAAPPALEVSRQTYRRCVRRVAVVSGVTLAVAGASQLVVRLALAGHVAVTVLALAALAGWLWLGRLAP